MIKKSKNTTHTKWKLFGLCHESTTTNEELVIEPPVAQMSHAPEVGIKPGEVFNNAWRLMVFVAELAQQMRDAGICFAGLAFAKSWIEHHPLRLAIEQLTLCSFS